MINSRRLIALAGLGASLEAMAMSTGHRRVPRALNRDIVVVSEPPAPPPRPTINLSDRDLANLAAAQAKRDRRAAKRKGL